MMTSAPLENVWVAVKKAGGSVDPRPTTARAEVPAKTSPPATPRPACRPDVRPRAAPRSTKATDTGPGVMTAIKPIAVPRRNELSIRGFWWKWRHRSTRISWPDRLAAVESAAMDAIDRKIIAELQADGRMSATELSDRIALSLSATSERLRRLQATGVISGFTVLVDPDAAGRPIQALVDVRLPVSDRYASELEAAFAELPAVIDAVHLTGPFDTQLRIAATDVGELDRLLARLKDDFGVRETNTRLILRTIDGFPRPPQV